jgi:hypothetical protein
MMRAGNAAPVFPPGDWSMCAAVVVSDLVFMASAKGNFLELRPMLRPRVGKPYESLPRPVQPRAGFVRTDFYRFVSILSGF